MEMDVTQEAKATFTLTTKDDNSAVRVEITLEAPGIGELSDLAAVQLVHAVVDAQLQKLIERGDAENMAEVLTVYPAGSKLN